MNYKKPLTLLILSIIITICSLKFGIFWDNVLFASKMGNILFENGILNWKSIPIESDPGHPPFLATLMALGWTLFNKSLFVSHWMMLPFVFGLLWQIDSFVTFFVKDKPFQIWAFLIVVSDATLLSQLVLVNPEVIQLFFFFIALNSVLKNNTYLKVVGLAFLGIVTYRGMMLCAGIFFIELMIHLLIKNKGLKCFFTRRTIMAYLIAAMPAVIYLVWRIFTKGWISSHPLEIWGNAWEFSSFKDFFKNLLRNFLVLTQRFTDFGRIAPMLFVLITLYTKRKSIKWNEIKPLIIIISFSTIVIYSTSLLIKNPMGHRYYIPSYLSLGLLSFLLLKEYKARNIIYTGMLSILLLGNFVVYPEKFAQGWDASLAHVPYWNLRENAINYMDKKRFPISETASFFPNCTTLDNINLNGDVRSFINFTGTEKYVFYSNVYNLSNEEHQILNQKYLSLKTFKSCNVKIEIMQKK